MTTANNSNARVKKHRDALRHAGLRPIQMWVADTRRPGFAEACRRQCLIENEQDRQDEGLDAFMDAALVDLLKDVPA